MRKRELTGTKYMPKLDAALDRNQELIVDELMNPHPQMPENKTGGGVHKICCSVPAQNPEAQPTQARGHIVWSKAYTFQAHAPSYLDPVAESDTVPYAR
jgi:hypothetical protein